MEIGYIKNWNHSRGWGFIEDEEGYDYFLNVSNVRKGIKIKEGMKVKFDIFQGQKGPEAENVSLV